LLIITLIHPFCGIELVSRLESSNNDLQQPLLLEEEETAEATDGIGSAANNSDDTSSITSVLSRRVLETVTPKNWLLPDDDRQLQLPGHVGLTVKLWIVATGLAIAAPSLGDVLNLVGCATGTIIAFILPGLLSLRIEGYSNLACLILVVGGTVGTVGTYFSVKKLVIDI
jgi:hypothetical protein